MLKESLKDDTIKGSNEMIGLRDWPTRKPTNYSKPENPNKVNLPVYLHINILVGILFK